MTAALTGTLLGIIIIVALALVKQLDKQLVYALILAGIGFLYVGFTWSDTASLVITALQAVAFLLLAYAGTRNSNYLIAGYFLHGCWDMAYNLFPDRHLIPPHYDWFCLTIDFTIGIYLLARYNK